MMALFGRTRSGTAEDVHQQLADLARAEWAEALAPDSTLPDGADTTYWPDGWDDPTSKFFVPPDHRSLYRRDAPGSEREAELLAYWDQHTDPRNIEVSVGGMAPRAAQLNRLDPDDQPVLRHLAALLLAYAESVQEELARLHAQRMAAWACAGCQSISWKPDPSQPYVPGVPPTAQLCPDCRVHAAEIVADRAAASPAGRELRDRIDAYLDTLPGPPGGAA